MTTPRWAAAFGAVALFLALLPPAGSQAAAVKNVTANVTVSPQIAIAGSNDLLAGVNVQNLTPGTSANNASKNVNPADNNTTTYYIKADAANSLNLDLCVNASGDLTTGAGDVIYLAGNFTWNDSRYNTTDFAVYPGVNFSLFPGTKTESKTIVPGERVYFRFYLNVPDNQPAGNYANTISFRAKMAGVACS